MSKIRDVLGGSFLLLVGVAIGAFLEANARPKTKVWISDHEENTKKSVYHIKVNGWDLDWEKTFISYNHLNIGNNLSGPMPVKVRYSNGIVRECLLPVNASLFVHEGMEIEVDLTASPPIEPLPRKFILNGVEREWNDIVIGYGDIRSMTMREGSMSDLTVTYRYKQNGSLSLKGGTLSEGQIIRVEKGLIINVYPTY